MKEALSEPTTASPIGAISAAQPARWKLAIAWSTAVVIALIAGVAIWSLTRPEPGFLTKFVIIPPPTSPLANSSGNEVAISPDGRRILYLAERDGTRQLYVRSIDDLTVTPIAGTEGASTSPFFSPDGGSVAFFVDGKLKKVSLMGGPPVILCEAGSRWVGGAWDSQDTIVFAAASEGGFGLYRVSAAGGEPESLAIPDPAKGERWYHNPQILPGGHAVLFTIWDGGINYQIAVLSLETGEHKIVLEGGRHARYAPTGHLVHSTETGTLMAVPFDLSRLEVSGDSVPILEGVRYSYFRGLDLRLFWRRNAGLHLRHCWWAKLISLGGSPR
ncbi:hypothetical protein MYX78_09475 [Acidobacteria bacterium AH-259-G07]|nr:hypothetical protein [Acidobacteria bacterium AH-259-G07]